MTVATPELLTRVVPLTVDHVQVMEGGDYQLFLTGSGDVDLRIRMPDEAFTLSQADGQDLAICTAADGTGRLAVQIVSWDAATKTAEVWVRVTLSVLSDVVLYLFYQANIPGGLTQPAPDAAYGSQAVWSDYAGVWHLASSGGVLDCTDSTANANDGTNNGAVATAGKVGGAASFNGAARISLSSTDYGTTHTTSLWLNFTASPNAVMLGETDVVGYHLYAYGPGPAVYYATSDVNFAGVSCPLTAAEWHLFTVVRSGTSVSFFRDGSQVGTTQTLGVNEGSVINSIGSYPPGTYGLNGLMDDLRISPTARSAENIATRFKIDTSTDFILAGTPGDAWPSGIIQHPGMSGGIRELCGGMSA